MVSIVVAKMLEIMASNGIPLKMLFMYPQACDLAIPDFVMEGQDSLFDSLHQLAITVRMGSNPEHIPKFASLISRAQLLTRLKILMHELEGSLPLLQELASIRLPYLEKLKLDNFELDQKDIQQLLKNHSRTLRSVTLAGIYMRHGAWMNVLFSIVDELSLRALELIELHETRDGQRYLVTFPGFGLPICIDYKRSFPGVIWDEYVMVSTEDDHLVLRDRNVREMNDMLDGVLRCMKAIRHG